ncbi:hypothetical protein FBU30_008984 [Linnemannia zychae]|nr:hypothetical protein FBU30_008984 [Linnemannia zychae]
MQESVTKPVQRLTNHAIASVEFNGYLRYKPDHAWPTCPYRSTRRHQSVRLLATRYFNSTYDPELGAYMDRWVRIAVMGQRRTHSTHAKHAFNTSGSPYTVTDINGSKAVSHSRSRHNGSNNSNHTLEPFLASKVTNTPTPTSHSAACLSSSVASTLEPSTTTSTLSSRMERFRESLDRIAVKDYDLPAPFRSSLVDTDTKKPMLRKKERKHIDFIWNDYLTISNSSGTTALKLTRKDYAKLLKIVRCSITPHVAANRTLVLQQDMDQIGIIRTSKMTETIIQAHFCLGLIPEAMKLYQEMVERVGEMSRDHKKIIWTMVDSFAMNGLKIEGVAFLDSLPGIATSDEEQEFYYKLYQRLYNSKESLLQRFDNLSSNQSLRQCLTTIEYFVRYPSPPQLKTVAGTLDVFRKVKQREGLVWGFSKMAAGMLIKMGDTSMMTLLLKELLQESQLGEANRVLNLMLCHGLNPELDVIRRHLVCFEAENDTKQQDFKSILEQWEIISSLQTKRISEESISLSNTFAYLHMQDVRTIVDGYADVLARCIQENDISGAQKTANFLAAHRWNERLYSLNFRQLNSHMVCFGRSESFLDYLQIRYTLGGYSEPDLHTYRRLIYAACRRSDLFSALSLFKQLQSKHPSWELDTTVYNAIISAAGATGQMRVAEKTFACLIEDGLTPDHYSFHGLLNGYVGSGDLEAAIMIPQQMVKYKLSPNTKTFNLVMKAYMGARRDLPTMQKLFRVMQHSGKAVPPDLVTFNQLLDGYRRTRNVKQFDAFFDYYFGPQGSPSEDLSPTMSPASEIPETDSSWTDLSWTSPKSSFSMDESLHRHSRKKDESAVGLGSIKPEKTDDWTLLIQLKHSLRLRNVDAVTVWELWHTLLPRLSPGQKMIPDQDVKSGPVTAAKVGNEAKAGDTAKNITSPIKLLHDEMTTVSFKRWLGGVSMAASDDDYFRFRALLLFRSAFKSRGQIKGIHWVDRLVAKMYPTHPAARKVHFLNNRRKKKHSRVLGSHSKNNNTHRSRL